MTIKVRSCKQQLNIGDDNTGVCQKTPSNQQYNAGNATQHVELHVDEIILNYTGGQLCHHSNTSRNTILEFVCGGPGTGLGQPQFIAESDDCTYYFKWNTEYVCEDKVCFCHKLLKYMPQILQQ